MIIKYTRSGGRKPPRDREQIEIKADGTFRMWRSVGAATYPPSPVGRFAGQLEKAANTQLQQKAEAAAKTGDINITPPPGAATERIELDGTQGKMGIHAEPEGPWGVLVEHLRSLLYDLTSFPEAAVAVEIVDNGRRAQLVHLGTKPLRLDLSQLMIRAVLWQGYQNVGDWHASVDQKAVPAEVTAQPGWSLDLPFEHGFNVTGDHQVVAYLSFSAFDGERPIPVSLESVRADS